MLKVKGFDMPQNVIIITACNCYFIFSNKNNNNNDDDDNNNSL